MTVPITAFGDELNGGLNTAATAAGMSTALNDPKQDPTVGLSWSTTLTNNSGGVNVRLIPADEVTGRIGTPWDLSNVVTAGGAPVTLSGTDQNGQSNANRYYFFEITFQGEVADTPMQVALDPSYYSGKNILTLSAIPEVQQVSFTPTPGFDDQINSQLYPQARKFTLTVDGKTYTPDMTYDPTGSRIEIPPKYSDIVQSMDLTANQMQIALQSLATVNPALVGVQGQITVTWVNGTTNPNTPVPGGYFQVVFGGQWAGIRHTIPKGTSQAQTPPPAAAGQHQTPDFMYYGSISSVVVIQGQMPVGSQPLVAEETRGSAGTLETATSIAMTSSGNFGMAWTQANLSTSGSQDTPYATGAQANQTTSGAVLNDSIYVRQFNESTDTAGPEVGGLYAVPTPSLKIGALRVDSSSVTTTPIPVAPLQYLVVTFDEAMKNSPDVNTQLIELGYTPGASGLVDQTTVPKTVLQQVEANWDDSVSNPNNYRLLQGGVAFQGGVAQVWYGLNESAILASAPYNFQITPLGTNKYEAVLLVTSNAAAALANPLVAGSYELQILHPVPNTSTVQGHGGVENIDGNSLGMTGFTPGGHDYLISFELTNTSGGTSPVAPGINQTDTPIIGTVTGTARTPVVASDPAGDYVVVWVDNTATGGSEILGQRFTPLGAPTGPLFVINTYTAGVQIEPAVAMDASGDFVVVWAGQGPNYNPVMNTLGQNNTSDVFAQRFNSNGAPQGPELLVNQYIPGVQDQPSVAMDSGGNFVVTWTSTGETPNANAAIYARQYNADGVPLTNEFQVSAASSYRQDFSSVASDGNGDFAIVWEGQESGGNWDVYGRYYTATGTLGSPIAGGQFILDTSSSEQPADPRVAIDSAGDFVATWAEFRNMGSQYDVYARMYGKGGVAKQSSEFLVNQTQAFNQYMPVVGMEADNGAFTIVWQTFGQDNADVNNPAVMDYGIYARMYNPDGSQFTGEFRVNATTVGDQVIPAISRASSQGTADGNAVIVWEGASVNFGIFSRIVDPPVGATRTTTPAAPVTTPTTTSTTTTTTPTTTTPTQTSSTTRTVTVAPVTTSTKTTTTTTTVAPTPTPAKTTVTVPPVTSTKTTTVVAPATTPVKTTTPAPVVTAPVVTTTKTPTTAALVTTSRAVTARATTVAAPVKTTITAAPVTSTPKTTTAAPVTSTAKTTTIAPATPAPTTAKATPTVAAAAPPPPAPTPAPAPAAAPVTQAAVKATTTVRTSIARSAVSVVMANWK